MPSFVFYGCPSLGGRGLHGELEGDFDGPGGGDGVEVGEAADVVDAHEFEDVFDADAVFHVGLAAEEAGSLGQEVEAAAEAGGVVLLGHAAVEDVEGEHFAQAQPLDEGEVVEEEPFEVVGGHEGGVAVHDELHGRHGVERPLREQRRVAAAGGEEHGHGHGAPDDAALGAEVDVAEGGEPQAAGDAGGGAVVAEAVEDAHLVLEADGGGVAGEAHEGAFAGAGAAAEGVGGEVDGGVPGEVADAFHALGARGGEAAVVEQARGGDVLRAHPGVDAEVAGPLFAEAEAEVGDILRGGGDVAPAEDVVAVPLVEGEAGGFDVVARVEAHIAEGVFHGEAALGGEGADEVEAELGAAVVEAVGHVAVEEVAVAEARGAHAAESQTEAFGAVVADEVVDGAEVELA